MEQPSKRQPKQWKLRTREADWNTLGLILEYLDASENLLSLHPLFLNPGLKKMCPEILANRIIKYLINMVGLSTNYVVFQKGNQP